MKYLALVCLLLVSVSASVQQDIQKHSKTLSNIDRNYQQMDRMLAKVAREILSAKNRRGALRQKIANLEEELEEQKENFSQTKEKYKVTKQQIKTLDKEKEKLEAQLRKLLAKEFGLMVALEDVAITTQESFIDQYVYEITSEYTNTKISQLNDKVITLAQNREKLAKQNREYEQIIAKMQRKQKDLIGSKKELDTLIAQLHNNQKSYQARIQRIKDEKNALAQTLENLKIVAQKEKEQRIARQKAERERLAKLKKEEEAAQTTTVAATQTNPLMRNDVDFEVRQIGSSYRQDNLYRYRGPKTISPIEGATVVRDFGTYTDPIYNIKIFNESIVLKPGDTPSNVRSVLNGEVLYAQETNMLGNVVIIKHDGDMHTIYAGLSKIAPGIKEGQRVAKGFVIGRVEEELTFEATKNSRHLNPSRLISLR
ncbi:MAG: murein hydrolase activator EnvC family protein [Campylobacterota bacterium]